MLTQDEMAAIKDLFVGKNHDLQGKLERCSAKVESLQERRMELSTELKDMAEYAEFLEDVIKTLTGSDTLWRDHDKNVAYLMLCEQLIECLCGGGKDDPIPERAKRIEITCITDDGPDHDCDAERCGTCNQVL